MSDYQGNKFRRKEEFLTLAFFDIWIGNDHRNPCNPNLMVGIDKTGNHFVPIDHGDIFNGGNIHMPLEPLTVEMSMLSIPLVNKLFSKAELSDRNDISYLRKKWYVCSQSCKRNLQKMLNNVPPEWLIQKEKVDADIDAHLLN